MNENHIEEQVKVDMCNEAHQIEKESIKQKL
jgi:hypothetical protein